MAFSLVYTAKGNFLLNFCQQNLQHVMPSLHYHDYRELQEWNHNSGYKLLWLIRFGNKLNDRDFHIVIKKAYMYFQRLIFLFAALIFRPVQSLVNELYFKYIFANSSQKSSIKWQRYQPWKQCIGIQNTTDLLQMVTTDSSPPPKKTSGLTIPNNSYGIISYTLFDYLDVLHMIVIRSTLGKTKNLQAFYLFHFKFLYQIRKISHFERSLG